MSATRRRKRFAQGPRDYAANLVQRGLIRAALALPYASRVRLMGRLVARVVAPLAGFNRRVRANLALVCPELSAREVRQLCDAVADNAGRSLIEGYSGAEFMAYARRSEIIGSGLAACDAAQAAGRPVIFVTAHIGNYLAARVALAGRGHQVGAVYRPMKNPYFNAHYVRSFAEFGDPIFEQGKRGMRAMLRHLSAGGVIGIPVDLHSYGGARLTFFDHPADTTLAPAELALKYNAALIPGYGLRQPDGLHFRVLTLAEVPHSDPETMMQAVNDQLEQLVRENMGQWFWIHRRWKLKKSRLGRRRT